MRQPSQGKLGGHVQHRDRRSVPQIPRFHLLGGELQLAHAQPVRRHTRLPAVNRDKYLSQLVPKILSSYVFTTQNAALFVTFAESSGSSVGNVPAIWAGPVAKTKFQSSKSYDHYSLLATIETAWGLSSLTSEDGSASDMTEFLKNLAPQTSLSYSPTRPVVGDSIIFSSTATGGTPPYTFSWNFGDTGSNVLGGTSLPNTMTHTYTTTGIYTLTLLATHTTRKVRLPP